MQPNGEEIISDLDAAQTEVTARMRFRQRRVLNFALSGIAVAAVVVGGAFGIRNNQRLDDRGGPPLGAGAPATTTTPPATLEVTTPPATSPDTAPASASPTRTTKPPAPVTTTTRQPAPPANPPDLHATAPSSV